MERAYSRIRVVLALLALLAFVLLDHVNSTTFARNSGAAVQTSYSQRDANACAPCGAPCPSERK